MKVRKFDLFVQQSCHRIMNALNGFFRNATVFVTGCFHKVGAQDAPDLFSAPKKKKGQKIFVDGKIQRNLGNIYPHDVNERSATFDTLEHHFAEPRKQQNVQIIVPWFASTPPKFRVLLRSTVTCFEQLIFAGLAKCS